MAALLFFIIFALAVAAFATQNTGNVHLFVGSYVLSNIPLYVVVVGSMLLGVFISWLVTIIDSISTLFMLHSKDALVRKSEEKIEVLQEKNHALEKELAEFKGQKEAEKEINRENATLTPSLFSTFKEKIGLSS